MNLIQANKQLSNSRKFNSKFTQLTRKKQQLNFCKSHQNDKRMISTKDTLRDQPKQQSNQINWKQFQQMLTKQIHQFKITKAKQISQIAIQSQIIIPKIIKRVKNKIQDQLLAILQRNIQNIQTNLSVNQQNNSLSKSAQKLSRSPKQLGSTIQHVFTPKTIQTPGFDFQSTQQKQVNQFSLRSNQFTLGYQKQMSPGIVKNVHIQQKINNINGQSLVSEFSLANASRNPTSKRIKDKIMNSRKNF